MKKLDFVTDMAVESANLAFISKYCVTKELSNGIKQLTLNVKTKEMSKEVGKPCGMYITYDVPKQIYQSRSGVADLTNYISSTLKNLIGWTKRSQPLLVVGLGNRHIAADALGEKVVGGVNVTRMIDAANKQSLCAIDVGVLGMTGMQSAEVVGGICDKIKPCCVLAIDSLATSVLSRVGTSFQISTSGIVPGSGVGQDRERIDKSNIGVQVISVGVPLMLTLHNAIYNIVKDYQASTGQSIDEFRLRERLSTMSGMIVSPKDIDFLISNCSSVIASAINKLI